MVAVAASFIFAGNIASAKRCVRRIQVELISPSVVASPCYYLCSGRNVSVSLKGGGPTIPMFDVHILSTEAVKDPSTHKEVGTLLYVSYDDENKNCPYFLKHDCVGRFDVTVISQLLPNTSWSGSFANGHAISDKDFAGVIKLAKTSSVEAVDLAGSLTREDCEKLDRSLSDDEKVKIMNDQKVEKRVYKKVDREHLFQTLHDLYPKL